jgi:hypothetical protein
MTRYPVVLLCALAISCGYPSEPQIEGLCAPPIKGKVVSSRPPCAGLIIQVTDGSFLPGQVQETFTDSSGDTFTNTFKLLGICEMSEQDALWLSDPNNFGKEFLFYFDDRVIEDNCAHCKPYVLFPDVKNRIVLTTGGCNDILE